MLKENLGTIYLRIGYERIRDQPVANIDRGWDAASVTPSASSLLRHYLFNRFKNIYIFVFIIT